MVLALRESVVIPKGLLRELYDGLVKVEEVLATIEELMDREGLQRISEAEKEYEKGEYVTACGSNEIKKLIEKRKRKELKYKAAPTKNFLGS